MPNLRDYFLKSGYADDHDAFDDALRNVRAGFNSTPAGESTSKADAARAAIASARLSGQPVDACTEEVLLAWGAGLLTDDELDEYVEAMKTYYSRRTRSVPPKG